MARSEPQWTSGTCRTEHRPRPSGGERSRFVSCSKACRIALRVARRTLGARAAARIAFGQRLQDQARSGLFQTLQRQRRKIGNDRLQVWRAGLACGHAPLGAIAGAGDAEYVRASAAGRDHDLEFGLPGCVDFRCQRTVQSGIDQRLPGEFPGSGVRAAAVVESRLRAARASKVMRRCISIPS